MNEVRFNDYIQSQNPIEDFIEKYLHLNGFGRKFKLIKGNVAEEGPLNFKEKVDNLNLEKICGNLLRVVTYIFLFPVPIICLGIREWNRSQKNITLNPLKDTLEDQKYKDLVQGNIGMLVDIGGGENPPQLPQVTIEAAANAIVTKLENISDQHNYQKYESLKKCFLDYDAAAPKAMQKWVEAITAEGADAESYVGHYLTLKFLKSKKCTLPEDTKTTYIAKINNYLKGIIETASHASEEEKKETILKFLKNINTGITQDHSSERKENLIRMQIFKTISDYSLEFWQNNENILTKIQWSHDEIDAETINSARQLQYFNEQIAKSDEIIESFLEILNERDNSLTKLNKLKNIISDNRLIIFPLINRLISELSAKKIYGFEMQLILLHFLQTDDNAEYYFLGKQEKIISNIINSLKKQLQSLSNQSEEERINGILEMLLMFSGADDITTECFRYLLNCNPEFWSKNTNLITKIRDNAVQYADYTAQAAYLLEIIEKDKIFDARCKEILELNDPLISVKLERLRTLLSENEEIKYQILQKTIESLCSPGEKKDYEMHLAIINFINHDSAIDYNLSLKLTNSMRNYLSNKLNHIFKNNQTSEIQKIINAVNPSGSHINEIEDGTKENEEELTKDLIMFTFNLLREMWGKNLETLEALKDAAPNHSNTDNIYNANLFLATIKDSLAQEMQNCIGDSKHERKVKTLTLFKKIAPEVLQQTTKEFCKLINSHHNFYWCLQDYLIFLNLLHSEHCKEFLSEDTRNELINSLQNALKTIFNPEKQNNQLIKDTFEYFNLREGEYRKEEKEAYAKELMQYLWDASPEFWTNNLDKLKEVSENFATNKKDIKFAVEFVEAKLAV